MPKENLVCQFGVKEIDGSGNNFGKPQATILPIKDFPEVDDNLRLRWANEVMKYFGKFRDSLTTIRQWDFVATLDGSVESVPMSEPTDGLIQTYPVHFQIPPTALKGVKHEEKVDRTELFAMAGLLYEIMTGKKPLEGLADDEVQRSFSIGKFPTDAATLHNAAFILSGWSAEFSQELTRLAAEKTVTPVQAMKNYARAHPILTGLQVAGATVSLLSLCVVPALGAIGFTAVGPAAGSAAVAWQASLGVVEAGSLFSWCQSVAMGGTALGLVQAAGAAGAAVAGGAGSVPELMETFKRGFRTPNQMERLEAVDT